MSDPKIHALSTTLCDLLGANSSNKNVENVSSVLVDLLSEITESNAKAYKKIIRTHCCDDDRLARNINKDIESTRATLVANLSALR